MRDATFTLWGLHALGLDWEADDFMQFVADLRAQRRRRAADHVRGRRASAICTEQMLDHLTGYEGSRPCGSATAPTASARTTSSARCSTRCTCTRRSAATMPQRLWPVLQDQVRCAIEVWDQPDQGIWEARGAPKHYVSSKLMCWVALDRGARLAGAAGRESTRRRSGRTIADEIREDILKNGVSERGVFRQHYETDALDASHAVDSAGPLPAPRRRARPCDGAGDRRGADRQRASCSATGSTRPTTASRVRRARS